MKTIQNNIIILFTSLILVFGFTSCKDRVGTTFGTVPGLFVDWQLIKIDTDCSQTGFNSNSVEEFFELELNPNNTFTYVQSGAETITGEFIVDNENITFIPPIYPQSISTTYEYSFTGRNFITKTTELIPVGNGVVETCNVRRVYIFDN